jgi:hypothetical protein
VDEIKNNNMEKNIQFINQHFDFFVKQYDEKKYPPTIYNKAKKRFSSLTADAETIKLALELKWGHINKNNYPKTHKQLITEIINEWENFKKSNHDKKTPYKNFEWWKNKLGRKSSSRYITIAFIIHLIHNEEIPIIDQHNYRALNFFSNNLSLSSDFKKRPSNWNDVINLKEFTDTILPNLNNTNPQDFDKFLMMFGKSIKK